MGRFSLECPHCGTINNASSSLFAKKKIQCAHCSAVIDARVSRMAVKTCTCGATFVFDQAKANNRVCPACGREVTLTSKGSTIHYVSVNCPQCGCTVDVDRELTNPICPACDYSFNMKEVVAKQKLVSDGNLSVIKYEGDNSTFVWKHPIEDFNSGSQLIVHESQEAIFFLNGEALDSFGPGRHTLTTENIPLLRSVYKLPTGQQSPFHAEVYFINKTVQMGIKWGTDTRIKFIDPITEIPLDIGAFGELSLTVNDPRKLLIKLVGTTSSLTNKECLSATSCSSSSTTYKTLQGIFKAPLIMEIKSYLASTIKALNINILEVDEHLGALSFALRQRIEPVFLEFGLSVPNFYISDIDLPDNSDFQRLKKLKSDSYLGVKEQEVAADIAAAKQKRAIVEEQTEAQRALIKAQAEAEALKMKGFAEAEVMSAQGITKRDYLQADVQIAYAQGLGSIGVNGGGSGVVGDMMGLGLGLAAMEQMRGQMGGLFTSTPIPSSSQKLVWNCSCGAKNLTDRFCPDCGMEKTEVTGWDCSCGAKNLTGKFCTGCGRKMPAESTWDCSCGTKNLTVSFCPNCGNKRGS